MWATAGKAVGSHESLGGQEGPLMQGRSGGGEDKEKVFVEFPSCAMHDERCSRSRFINEMMRLFDGHFLVHTTRP